MTEFLQDPPKPRRERADEREPSPPLAWAQFSRSIRYQWAKPLLFIDWLAEWSVYWLRHLSIITLLETCSSFTLLVGLIFYFAESPQRTKTRHYQAWQVINTAQGKGGSGGRIDALRELNEDHVQLVGVDVSDSYLQGVELGGADLRRSTFRGADLRGAYLAGTDFQQASLSSANFRHATLDHANLGGADLTDCDLAEATLANAAVHAADFSRADLRGADLSGLTEWQSAVFHLANIHGVRNPPAGFIASAEQAGAVDLADDDAWEKLLKSAGPRNVSAKN